MSISLNSDREMLTWAIWEIDHTACVISRLWIRVVIGLPSENQQLTEFRLTNSSRRTKSCCHAFCKKTQKPRQHALAAEEGRYEPGRANTSRLSLRLGIGLFFVTGNC